jgi:iron complex transport system permease protein
VWAVRLLLLLGLTVVAAAVGLAVGAEPVSLADLVSGDAGAAFIVGRLRLPRVLAGLFVGGALAACGAAFQGLLRNPLASPFVLGVSGGGALGAVLGIVLGLEAVVVFGVPLPTRAGFAFLGCLLALVLIYAIAQRRGRVVPQTLLLAGVVANAFFLSILGFLQYLANPHQSQEILRWMMGGLHRPTLVGMLLTGGLVLLGVAWLTRAGRELNVVTLGEESAQTLGVPVQRLRRGVFVVASMMTGLAVAAAGPIGFVGLFVPHAVRLVWGPDHRLLVPGSFLAGGAFLVLADALGRWLSRPGEMPVGLITAAVGAPCFILLLVRGWGYGRRVD